MPKKSSSKKESKKVAKEITTLSKEIKQLTKEVRKLKNLEYLKVFKHPWKFMGFSLLKGILVGLGSVLGASVILALLVYLLSQISFVPIVGDFVQDIINQIQPAAQ